MLAVRVLLFALCCIVAAACFVQAQSEDKRPYQVVQAKNQKVHVHVLHAHDKEDAHSRRVIHRIMGRVGKEHRHMLHKLEHVLASLKAGQKVEFDAGAEAALDAQEEKKERKALIKAEIKNKLRNAIKSGNKKAIKALFSRVMKKADSATLQRIIKNSLGHAKTAEERRALEQALEKAKEKEIEERKRKAAEETRLKQVSSAQAQKEIESLLEKMKNPENGNNGIVMHGKKCKKTQRNSWEVEYDEYGGKMTKSQLSEVRAMHERVDGLLEQNPTLSIVESTLRGATGQVKHAHDQHVWLRGDALPAWNEESLVPGEIQDEMSGRWQDAINIDPF